MKGWFGDAEVFVVVTVPEIKFGVGERLHDDATRKGGGKFGVVKIDGETLHEPPVVAGKMFLAAHLGSEAIPFAPTHDDGAGVVADERAFAGGEGEVKGC